MDLKKLLPGIRKIIGRSSNKATHLVLFLTYLCCFLPWALAFWPGIFTFDSLVIWSEIRSWQITNLHGYIYVLLNAALEKLFGSSGSIVIMQVVVTAALGAVTFGDLVSRSRGKFIAILVALAFGLSPAVALMNVVTWKDVPFSLMVAWLVAHLLKAAPLNWAPSYLGKAVVLGGWLALGAAFRANGLLLIPVVPLALLWARLYPAKLCAAIFLIGTLCTLAIRGPLARTLDVNMHDKWNFRMQKLQTLAALRINSKRSLSVLSNEERTLLERFYPLDTTRRYFNSSDSLPLMLQLDVSTVENNRVNSLLLSSLIKLAGQNPAALFSERSCFLTSALLAKSYIYNDLSAEKDAKRIAWEESVGASPSPKSELLNRILTPIQALTLRFPWRLVCWNLWLPFGLMVAVFFKALKNHDRSAQAVVFLLSCNIFGLLVFALAADWRYFYFLHLSGFPMAFYLFAGLNAGCSEKVQQ